MTKQPISILLVEDDFADAVLISRILDRCDTPFQVHHVTRLGEAAVQINQGEFEVVLLDLTLPDSQLLHGLQQLNDRHPDLPIVILTNLADNRVALQTLECGAQDYVIKDQLEPKYLERTVQYAMQRQQLVAENRRLMHSLEQIARVDPLTQILNRHHFSEELGREWNRIRRSDQPVSCVLIDADHFKRINDTYGHQVGDQTLKELARAICQAARSTDIVCRYGGEEFCAILPETDEKTAAKWADRLRSEIEMYPLSVGDQNVPLTVSLGVAGLQPDMECAEELVDHADQALLVAKQSGRNQVVMFSELMNLTASGDEEMDDPFLGMPAKDVMSPIVVPLLDSQSILIAVRFILMLRMDSVPVVDEDGRLAGVITEEDLISRAMSPLGWTGSIGQVMNQRPVCFEETTPARTICDFLGRVSVRRVIITRGDRPVGVVSRNSLVRWQRNRFVAQGPQGCFTAQPQRVPAELKLVVEEMVREIDDLQIRIRQGSLELGPMLVSKASRMQELIDESLGLCPAGSSADRNLGMVGHLLG